MSDTTSPRQRYAQVFVFLLLFSFLYVMVQSLRSGGINNFQEHFYQKKLLMEKAALLRMKLGDQVFPGALMGENGWMEYSGEWTIDDYQNLRTFDSHEIFIKGIKTLDQYLKSEGITLVIVIAPNKGSIYPENIPQPLTSLPIPSRLDDLHSYLEDNDLAALDLRPALQTARKGRDVYFKTDTHWNGYGAFVAYTTIINTLKDSYPELKPYEISDLEYKITSPETLEIPGMLQITTIKEADLSFVPRKPLFRTLNPGNYDGYNQFSWIPNSTLPTIMMFHDSFGEHYLDDYLSMNFSKSHFFHLASMPKYLSQEAIQQFEPDIIIIEIVERNLQDLPLYFPGFMLE